MKRKLLLLTALVVSALMGMRAQQTPQADGTYYLYNSETGKFLSRGAGYGTAACADNFGIPVTLKENDGGYQIQYMDAPTNYVSDAWWSWSDGGTDRAQTYELESLADGKYKLYSKTHNHTLTLYINEGAAVSEFKYQVASNGGSDNCNVNWDVWQFVTSQERDNIIKSVVSANESKIAQNNNYTITTTLSDLLSDANTFAATDKTSSVTNAALSENAVGWTITGSTPGAQSGCLEVYQGYTYLKQTVENLPSGIYKVSLNGYYRDGSNANCVNYANAGWIVSNAYLEANGNQTMIKPWASERSSNDAPNNRAEAKAMFNEGKYLNEVYTEVGEDGKLAITIAQPGAAVASRWFCFSNLKLTYYSDKVSDEDKTAILQTVTELENDPMNEDVRQNLTNAKSTFDSTSTIQNYNALGAAITAAQNSINAYKNAKAVLDAILAEAENTNIYTAESFAAQYTSNKNKYDDRSMTDAEASAMRVGDHYAGNLPPVLLSAWKKGETPAINNSGFYINTWSGEGNNDGSNFKTPFYEYWVGDNDVLAATTLTAVQTGLEPNQTYKVSIWARVRQTNNATKATNGITMKVGEGNSVDISAGSQIGTSPLYIGEYAAVGETDADGKLTVTITVNEGSNISWLSFKNVKFEESTGVVPTELTLSVTEVTLNLGETKKVTATILPEDAEVKTVIWTSSDGNVATVANGEIMAVGEGTATITAKAEGNESLTKAVAVTVNAIEAPEFFTTELVDNTDYYIYNAALGKFLGGANSWGTQASMIEHGIPFTLAIADGKYTLDSHTYNNQNEHFFNGTFVDGASTSLNIAPISDGKFSISTGENANYVAAKAGSTVVDNTAGNASNPFAQWYFISKADRDKLLLSVSESNPVDATYYIKEANISRNLRVAYNQSGWTGISYGEDKNQEITNYNAQVWNKNVDVSQEITGILNGTYTLRMQGFTSGTNVQLTANDVSVDVQSQPSGITSQKAASTLFANKECTNELIVTVTENKLTISLSGDCTSGKWLCYDNFELYLTGLSESSASMSVKAGKYGTFIAPFDVTLPKGVSAYTVEEMDGSTLVLTSVEGSSLTANTAVVLENTTDADVAETFTGVGTATEDTYTTGLLTGYYKPVLVAASTDAVSNYILQTQDGKQAFRKVTADYTTQTPNRAYLSVEGSSDVKAISFPGQGDATGINAVSTLLGGDVEGIYTVGGAKVNNLQKGMNIIRTADGKTQKVLVK